MGLDRRSFLKYLGLGGVVAATVDVDKLLWVPGEKTYFLPSGKVFDSGLVDAQWLSRECLRLFENRLAWASRVLPEPTDSIPIKSLRYDKSEIYSVDLKPPDFSLGRDEVRKRYLEPAIYALSELVNFEKVTEYRRLHAPKLVDWSASAESETAAIMVSQAWSPLHRKMIMRIDVGGRPGVDLFTEVGFAHTDT